MFMNYIYFNFSGFTNKNPPSSKHQMLVYISLLETTKPYLTSSIRVPILPVILLFSHSLETNASISRIISDSWLEIRFADAEQGQNELLKAVMLRKQWLKLLNLKLEMASNTIRNDKVWNILLCRNFQIQEQICKVFSLQVLTKII